MFVQSVVRARSEVEAAWLIYEAKPGTRLIAGGTDLMLQLSRGRKQASALVDLRRAGMDHVLETDDDIRIGASATVAAIARHDGIRAHFPDLHRAAITLASPQIRNMATIGGNLGNASPAADLVTPLVAREARVRVRCGDELRDIAINGFFTGPGASVLSPQEMVTEVILPKQRLRHGTSHGAFYKLGFRGAQIIAVVNLSIYARVHRGVVEDARLALGAVAPTVVRASSAERLLRNNPLTPDAVRAAAKAALADISPIDDLRATAAYRRRVTHNFVRLALEEIAAQAAAVG